MTSFTCLLHALLSESAQQVFLPSPPLVLLRISLLRSLGGVILSHVLHWMKRQKLLGLLVCQVLRLSSSGRMTVASCAGGSTSAGVHEAPQVSQLLCAHPLQQHLLELVVMAHRGAA